MGVAVIGQTIKIDGAVDAAAREALWKAMCDVGARRNVTLDMRATTRFDVRMVEAVVAAAAAIASRGGSVTVEAGPATLDELLHLGIADLLTTTRRPAPART
jgi:anti-anti-sigma regulatory factor